MTTAAERPSIVDFMAKTWKSGGMAKQPYKLSILIFELEQILNIDVYDTGERKLIVGTRNIRKQLWEVSETALVAIAPGIIVCDMSPDLPAMYCTGVLERDGENGYIVKTFASLNDESIYGYAWIKIGPGRVNHSDAAAVFLWCFGRDEGGSLGISPEHWASLHPRIERWLAPAK